MKRYWTVQVRKGASNVDRLSFILGQWILLCILIWDLSQENKYDKVSSHKLTFKTKGVTFLDRWLKWIYYLLRRYCCNFIHGKVTISLLLFRCLRKVAHYEWTLKISIINDYQSFKACDKKEEYKTGISTEPQAPQDTRFLMQGIMHSANCDIIKINHFIWSMLSTLN